MKRNLLFVSFIILAILFTGCSFADEYDKKYSKVWKSDDGKFSFTCDNKKRLNGRGEYKATYKGKDNLINIWVEGNGEPRCLGIDTDTNDGDSLFGGEYTYNGNDKNSITVVIDYVYRKRPDLIV